jgi:GGDEF domain-containing protein
LLLSQQASDALTSGSQRIAGVVRETDLLARISGDEFVLLV